MNTFRHAALTRALLRVVVVAACINFAVTIVQQFADGSGNMFNLGVALVAPAVVGVAAFFAADTLDPGYSQVQPRFAGLSVVAFVAQAGLAVAWFTWRGIFAGDVASTVGFSGSSQGPSNVYWVSHYGHANLMFWGNLVIAALALVAAVVSTATYVSYRRSLRRPAVVMVPATTNQDNDRRWL
jgi:hypothetical protein